MPELPEVEALRVFLDDHLVGRVIDRVLPLDVSALKTYDPPLTALHGGTVTDIARHGKFLDCPVCGDTVREVSFSDSSLQYCPTCQTGGRRLADRRLSRLLK
ncbi:DNA-formamidopyrimidine glycosylase family protein [Streptomyces sp. NPDC093149]|uniref:DNA-formamidopyrimidine glycosylase family protein n=1 Tax=Streptomyces sp. NPDC093149 TaxID=3366031 RepID=UPI0038182FF2